MLTTCEAVYATANKVINANTEFYLFKKKGGGHGGSPAWSWLGREVEIEKGGLVAEGEGKQSGTWQMKSYTYQDEHASIHVVNVHNTYKHNMVYT